MVQKYTGSIKSIGEKLENDYLVASSLVKFLVKKGHAVEKGVGERAEGAKGKGSMLYEVTVPVTILEELASPIE